jgi:cytochrome c553
MLRRRSLNFLGCRMIHSPCPDLIRASIENGRAFREMDCRVKPGNDEGKEIKMRVAPVAILLTAALFGSWAHAADVKEKAETCKVCHGDNAVSQMENIPSLAGQLDQYIQWQLVYFRSGARKNEQMQPIVEELTNEDVRNLGAYFAALPPFKADKGDNPDLSAKGKQAAAGRRCASCHGDDFAGTKAVARLAGQREDYLAKTLHDYKSSARNGGPQGVMSDVAYSLSNEEITALSHFLAHFPANGG